MRVKLLLLIPTMLVGCAATTNPSEQNKLLLPTTRGWVDDNPWESCSAMKPVEGASDGSQVMSCVDKQKRRFQVVYREGKPLCTAVIVADKHDDYQHFACELKYELMIRPEKAKN